MILFCHFRSLPQPPTPSKADHRPFEDMLGLDSTILRTAWENMEHREPQKGMHKEMNEDPRLAHDQLKAHASTPRKRIRFFFAVLFPALLLLSLSPIVFAVMRGRQKKAIPLRCTGI